MYNFNPMGRFFLQYPFLLPVAVWAIIQTVKIVIRLQDKTFPRKYLWSGGGMPSAHAAFVTSIVTLLALTEGVLSNMFALALVFAAIVLYDAMHVRYEAGKHAARLNQLASQDLSGQELNSHLGHTWQEVSVGSILGILLALMFLSF